MHSSVRVRILLLIHIVEPQDGSKAVSNLEHLEGPLPKMGAALNLNDFPPKLTFRNLHCQNDLVCRRYDLWFFFIFNVFLDIKHIERLNIFFSKIVTKLKLRVWLQKKLIKLRFHFVSKCYVWMQCCYMLYECVMLVCCLHIYLCAQKYEKEKEKKCFSL